MLVLSRGPGDPRLAPSTESEANPGLHHIGVFKNKSASMVEFASFLSGVAGVPVIDKTGLTGRYRFDLDWSERLDPGNPDSGLASDGAKKLGLKLEPGKDSHKWLVIDRAKMNPAPN